MPRYLKGVERLLNAERDWKDADAPLPKTALLLWRALPSLCAQAASVLSGQRH